MLGRRRFRPPLALDRPSWFILTLSPPLSHMNSPSKDVSVAVKIIQQHFIIQFMHSNELIIM